MANIKNSHHSYTTRLECSSSEGVRFTDG